MDLTRFEPAGECIYCGAKRYSEQRQRLGAEHIIAEGLGGKLLLKDASCGPCEAATSKVELWNLKHMFGPARYRLKFPSKRKKELPTTVPIEFTYGGPYQLEHVPIGQAPLMLCLPALKYPGIIAGEAPDARGLASRTIVCRLIRDSDWEPIVKSRRALGARTLGLPIMDDRFPLMLAKIGHAYWRATRLYEDFLPLLPNLIRGRPNALPLSYLVGGAGDEHTFPAVAPIEESNATGHDLELQIYELGHPLEVVTVLIRLFNSLLPNAPVYRVVVAANFDPPLPDAEAQLMRERLQHIAPII